MNIHTEASSEIRYIHDMTSSGWMEAKIIWLVQVTNINYINSKIITTTTTIKIAKTCEMKKRRNDVRA